MRLLTCSCFLVLHRGRILLLSFPVLLGICLPSLWITLSPLHALALILLSLTKVPVSPTLRFGTLDCGSVPFPFGKGGYGILANCSHCGIEATVSFSAGPVCSNFSAGACAILQALCSSRQNQKVYNYSFLLLFDYCSVLTTLFLFSIFSFTTISLEDPSGTVFSFLLFCQTTMGPRALVSPGERRG